MSTKRSRRPTRGVLVTGLIVALASIAPTASAHGFGSWRTAVNAETAVPGTSTELNSSVTDGCPILSPSGLRLYMATNRTGGPGGLDIWVARRASIGAPWGAPQPLPAPVNSAADDFCPTPLPNGRLLFVSSRVLPDACGGPDIYATKLRDGQWLEPTNLGCNVNSAAGEAGPSLVTAGPDMLYFSSTRPDGFSDEPDGALSGDADIYASPVTSSGFGPAVLVPGLNTASNDARPNVRRDGLEIVFDSDRPGTLGGTDIYAATRHRLWTSWSAPVNLGSAINSPTSESRASLSWDGRTLVFGSTRPESEAGSNDIYVSTRRRFGRS